METFDGATGRLNLETVSEIGEPSVKILEWGNIPTRPPVAIGRRKRTYALEGCTKGRQAMVLKAEAKVDLSGSKVGSKGRDR